MTILGRYRLDGLESDNLLAFLALLGLLRTLEAACPQWRRGGAVARHRRDLGQRPVTLDPRLPFRCRSAAAG